MADHDVPQDRQYWDDRAQEMLSMARNAKEIPDRERLLKVARSYRRLAVRAQDWTNK